MTVYQYLSTQLLSPRILYGFPRRWLSRPHHAGRLRISSATVTRAGSQARNPSPSEDFLEGFLAVSPGGGKEERATTARRMGKTRPMSPTSIRYSSPAKDQLVCASGIS